MVEADLRTADDFIQGGSAAPAGGKLVIDGGLT
jgi:hypothetical protein